MPKEVLQTQLDTIQDKITNTVAIFRRLLAQLDTLESIITKLEASSPESPEIMQLKAVKQQLGTDVDGLIDSIAILINEYQEFMQKSI